MLELVLFDPPFLLPFVLCYIIINYHFLLGSAGGLRQVLNMDQATLFKSELEHSPLLCPPEKTKSRAPISFTFISRLNGQVPDYIVIPVSCLFIVFFFYLFFFFKFHFSFFKVKFVYLPNLYFEIFVITILGRRCDYQFGSLIFIINQTLHFGL